MIHPRDLTGLVFGWWTIERRADNTGKQSAWLCKCKCGRYRTVPRTSLVQGRSKSCGCGRNAFESATSNEMRAKAARRSTQYVALADHWAKVERDWPQSLRRMAQEAMR